MEMKKIKKRPKRIWEMSPTEKRVAYEKNFWEGCKWIMEVGTKPCPHCGKKRGKNEKDNSSK